MHAPTLRENEIAAHLPAPNLEQNTQIVYLHLAPTYLKSSSAITLEIDLIKTGSTEIIIIFTTSHSIQHLVTILRAHCGAVEEWL